MDEEVIQTYELSLDETSWIKCLRCGMKSYNENDIKYLYCGKCGFHDLNHPPLRREIEPSNPSWYENRS